MVRRLICGFVAVLIFRSLKFSLQPAGWVVAQHQLTIVIRAAALSGDGKERPSGRPDGTQHYLGAIPDSQAIPASYKLMPLG